MNRPHSAAEIAGLRRALRRTRTHSTMTELAAVRATLRTIVMDAHDKHDLQIEALAKCALVHLHRVIPDTPPETRAEFDARTGRTPS